MLGTGATSHMHAAAIRPELKINLSEVNRQRNSHHWVCTVRLKRLHRWFGKIQGKFKVESYL